MTSEKYGTAWGYAKARLSRALLRATLSPLVRWRPLDDPEEGATVVVAASRKLLPLLAANLTLLERQDLTGIRAVIVVIDAQQHQVEPGLDATLRGRFRSLPLRVLFYSRAQAAVAHFVDWGWIYAWMSWSLATASATTRWVMLHDLDALLIRPSIVLDRVRGIAGAGATYVGVRYYAGGGITPDDRLVTTFELIFDAAFVRRTFRPIALFNQVRRLEGRRVEFDTFLSAQQTAGVREVLPIDEEWMVHPSQMICQYVEHVNGRRVPPGTHNLLLIPYYFHLGGEPALLRDVLGQLRRGPAITLFGRPLDASRLDAEHVAWYAKQASRVERHLFGETRTEIAEYFAAIEQARAAPAPVHHGAQRSL